MRIFKFALLLLAAMIAVLWLTAPARAGGYGNQVTSANVVLNDMGAAGFCPTQTYQTAGQLNVVARQTAPVTFTLVPYQPVAQLPAIQPQVAQPVYQAPATVQLQVTQPTYTYSAALVQPQQFNYSHSFSQNLNAGGYRNAFNQQVRFNHGHQFNQAARLNAHARHNFNQAVRVNQRLAVQAVGGNGLGNQTVKTKTVTANGILGLRNRQVTKTTQSIRNR